MNFILIVKNNKIYPIYRSSWSNCYFAFIFVAYVPLYELFSQHRGIAPIIVVENQNFTGFIELEIENGRS